MILPIGFRSSKFGKWSLNWEEPYRIEEVISRNSYMVQSIQGTSPPRAINEKYMKKYYPSNNIIALSIKIADETL
jgi:hypothetical protein